MSAERIKVFVADDHAVLRAGLAMLVNAQDDMTVVGEAADGARRALRRPFFGQTWSFSTSACRG